MTKIIYLILLGASLALALFFYFQYDQASLQLTETRMRLAEMDQQAAPVYPEDMAGRSGEDTASFIPPPSAQFEGEIGTLSSTQVDQLRQLGLPNPESDLLNDLYRTQKSLVPSGGQLGGNMAVRDARILTDRYAIAYFEDGHEGGYMVLRFSVQPGPAIRWQVVDSHRL
jgi:hypothetical protein